MNFRKNETHIFWSDSADLFDYVKEREKQVRDWVYALSESTFNVADDEILQGLVSKWSMSAPVLDFDSAEVVDKGTKKISVKGDSRFWVDEDVVNPAVNGNFLTFAIPYTGDPALFGYKSNFSTRTPIIGEIKTSEIRITLEDAIAFTEESLSKKKESVFSGLKHCAQGATTQAATFNNWLKTEGLRLIEEKRKTISATDDLIEKLGFKLRRREEQPANISQPIVRKVLGAFEEQKALGRKKPTPTLEMSVYEEILTICGNMARVMELSPRAFAEMREEDLRFHFLVQLNGVFDGQATGETFNLNGKTDILIRHEGENLFIAECKFWTGEKDYQEAINQLIGYTSWHDTKTALIIFNRNKDFSSVLKKLQSETSKHKNCIETLTYESNTGFRFRFKQEKDPSKTFITTVMAFNVPSTT